MLLELRLNNLSGQILLKNQINKMSVFKFDIEDAKDYLYDELKFSNNRQSKYYPKENVNKASDVFNILNNHYMIGKDEDFYLDLIQYLRDNKKLK